MAVVPTDRRTTWKPGIYGGVPPDDANASTFPNGVGPCTQYGDALDPGDNIQTALNSAGAVATKASRRFVKLNAGTFSVGSQLSIPSYVILRGTKGANGASPTTILDQTFTGTLVVMWGGSGTWGTVRSVSGTHTKGSTTITVDNATDFAAGDILCIDQIQDGTMAGPSNGIAVYNVPSTGNWVWLLSSLWYQRQDYSLGAGVGFLFPDCEDNTYRPISQRVEVLSKNGNVLTIHDPNATICGSPLHVTYYNTSQIYRSAGTGEVRRYAGLEDVRIYPSGTNGQRVVSFGQAAFCWAKGIEIDGTTATGNTWSGRHLEIYAQSYRCEVRGCYFHGSSNYNQGGNAYGIDYQGSECLIEDNIVRQMNKPIVAENSGGGNVIGYNYVDEAVIQSLDNSWQEAAISTHASFCHSDLFEGNHTPNLGSDATHGNNGWLLIYRNYATGSNSSGYANTYRRAIFSDGWNREITSVGNVLWNPAIACDYQILTPDDGVNPVFNAPDIVYLLGSNAWQIGTYNKPGADYWDNGQAADLFYRHLDYDAKSAAQYQNPANGDTTLPNSMYLTSKPGWFGDYTWPWVDPTQSTHALRVKTLPAKQRYDDGTPFLELDSSLLAGPTNLRWRPA